MFAAPADESSPPSRIQTPPRAKDPPEAALTPVLAGLTPAHDDHLPTALPTPTTTMMPLPPPLEDAPLTQEWSTSQQENLFVRFIQYLVQSGILVQHVMQQHFTQICDTQETS